MPANRRLTILLCAAAMALGVDQPSQAERYRRPLQLDRTTFAPGDEVAVAADPPHQVGCDCPVCAASEIFEGCEAPAGLFGEYLHPGGGISAEYVYTGEVFTNARGGIDTNDATKYRGNLDIVFEFDLDALGWRPGGLFVLYGENGHGRGISEYYVGDYQILSNIDADDFMQVSEFWWERELFDDLLVVRLGKQDANAEFASVEIAETFIGSSFGYQPNIPMPTFPDPSMAAVVLMNLSDGLTAAAGVWDGAPNGGNWGFSGTGTTFTIGELRFGYALGDGKPRSGVFDLGMWYHSDTFDDLRTSVPHAGNFGVYGEWEQQIFFESCDPDDGQGLGAFAQFSWAPDDLNEVKQYFGGGLVYTGLVDGRDDDLLGVGVAHTIFSDALGVANDETVVEMFYLAPVASWLTLQPDFQYIANPSGVERDALAIGLRFECVF